MSFEHESMLDPAPTMRPASPAIVVGLALGLLAMSPFIVVFFWPFAPIIPLLLAGITALLRQRSLAEGFLAAAVFAVIVVAIVYAGFFVLATFAS